MRLLSILSESLALWGLMIIPPWLKTRSMGEVLAGTDSVLIARGKSLDRIFLLVNQKCRHPFGPLLSSNSAANSRYLLYWVAKELVLSLLCRFLL